MECIAWLFTLFLQKRRTQNESNKMNMTRKLFPPGSIALIRVSLFCYQCQLVIYIRTMWHDRVPWIEHHILFYSSDDKVRNAFHIILHHTQKRCSGTTKIFEDCTNFPALCIFLIVSSGKHSTTKSQLWGSHLYSIIFPCPGYSVNVIGSSCEWRTGFVSFESIYLSIDYSETLLGE